MVVEPLCVSSFMCISLNYESNFYRVRNSHFTGNKTITQSCCNLFFRSHSTWRKQKFYPNLVTPESVFLTTNLFCLPKMNKIR